MESHGGAQMQDNTSPPSSSGFNFDRLPDDSARDTPGEYWHRNRNRNWNRSWVTTPSRAIEVKTYQEVRAIVRDDFRFLGPVLAVGSMHSVTDVIVIDRGTLILLSGISSALGLVRIVLAVYLGWQCIEGLRFVSLSVVNSKLEVCQVNLLVNLLLNPLLLMGISVWVLLPSSRTGPTVPCAAARAGKLA